MSRYTHKPLKAMNYQRYRDSHWQWRKRRRKKIKYRKNKPQKALVYFARKNRLSPTQPEKFFNSFLYKYNIPHSFQRIIGVFIVDFFFISRSLIVEVDGSSHQGNKEYDDYRENCIKSLGFKVLRFTNSQIMNNPKVCLEQILQEPEDLSKIADNKILLIKAKQKHWRHRCKFKACNSAKVAKDSTSRKAYTGSAYKWN